MVQILRNVYFICHYDSVLGLFTLTTARHCNIDAARVIDDKKGLWYGIFGQVKTDEPCCCKVLVTVGTGTEVIRHTEAIVS